MSITNYEHGTKRSPNVPEGYTFISEAIYREAFTGVAS